VFATLPDALAECTSSIGFTARVHGRRTRLDWRAVQDDVSARANDRTQRIALVFGNETTGLTAEESTLCGELVHIATSAEHTSLNLAIAVGIVLSDLFAERGFKKLERGAKALSGEGREYLKANLRHVLVDKVARTPSARRDVLAMIDRVFSRAPLEDRDARAWHLVLRALGSELTPKDVGVALGEKRARRKAAVRAAKAKPRRSP
jgi:tRNA C32,U32 (ribose-2'-O)-methylase TrmJ